MILLAKDDIEWNDRVAIFSALGNEDKCHSFLPSYSIDVIVEGNRKGKGGKKLLEKR